MGAGTPNHWEWIYTTSAFRWNRRSTLVVQITKNDPRHAGGEISDIYNGAPIAKVPTPIPPINRPATIVA
ncbi:uncharacterized protein AKAW2_80031A [Aspergillus luchuensis]|uniref:Uncharacterized protein n=1 Tax=Aspergillus kawachii TaxID=1069201 RepID=A0A7R7WKB2_ASPKA|nr:uncharacterized protein AKAW2_80031A [Aspergillus luchuensis]BCS04230.1 hypothetical protein AKAW2_80031A [Aspergillus luchuensis]